MKKVVITYGTYDLLHKGHTNLLEKAKGKDNYLIVAVSSDEFNNIKGKNSYQSFEDRVKALEKLGYIDLIIKEESWDQKKKDITKYEPDFLVMGSDWEGEFDHLSNEKTKVIYFDRTKGISSSQLRELIGDLGYKSVMSNIKEIETNLIDRNEDLSYFKGKNIATYGTFDTLHKGHKNIIEHAIKIAGKESLVWVGVSSDKWNKIKGKKPEFNQEQRISMIKADYPNINVFLEDHIDYEESWFSHWDDYNFSLIIMGGDHKDGLSYINSKNSKQGKEMKIVFFERTPGISSTKIKEMKI